MESSSTDTQRAPDPRAPDLLALARGGSLDELVASLFDPETLAEEPGPVPRRANQVARLILSEAVRLIRLGTQAELKEAGVELVRAQSGKPAKTLEERFPEAFRLLSAAAVTLRAATAPSSSGGEISVLRGWNKNAVRVLKTLRDAPENEMSRADLRQLFDFEDSYLSHLLRAMEAAGLVVRIRDGRTVNVHLGPIGQADHVQAIVEGVEDPTLEDEVKKLFAEVLQRSPKPHGVLIEGIEELEKEVRMLWHEIEDPEIEIVQTIATSDLVVCRIRAAGRPKIGQDDGEGHVVRWLSWQAECDRGKIKRVGLWTKLRGVTPSRTPQREGLEVRGVGIGVGEGERSSLPLQEKVFEAFVVEERQEIRLEPGHELGIWTYRLAPGAVEKTGVQQENANQAELGRELQTD